MSSSSAIYMIPGFDLSRFECHLYCLLNSGIDNPESEFYIGDLLQGEDGEEYREVIDRLQTFFYKLPLREVPHLTEDELSLVTQGTLVKAGPVVLFRSSRYACDSIVDPMATIVEKALQGFLMSYVTEVYY